MAWYVHKGEQMKNIIYDEWLSDILKYEAYNILVDENLIKGNAASTLDDLCSKKALLIQ